MELEGGPANALAIEPPCASSPFSQRSSDSSVSGGSAFLMFAARRDIQRTESYPPMYASPTPPTQKSYTNDPAVAGAGTWQHHWPSMPPSQQAEEQQQQEQQQRPHDPGVLAAVAALDSFSFQQPWQHASAQPAAQVPRNRLMRSSMSTPWSSGY